MVLTYGCPMELSEKIVPPGYRPMLAKPIAAKADAREELKLDASAIYAARRASVKRGTKSIDRRRHGR